MRARGARAKLNAVDLRRHIYNTQLMQSEAVSLAYRTWRREWRGKGKEYVRHSLRLFLASLRGFSADRS